MSSRAARCLFAGLAIALAAAGCRSTSPAQRYAEVYLPPVEDTGYRQVSLLFDARPGPLTAEDFSFRSDWPVAYGSQSLGETTYYVEYYRDYFGPNLNSRDHFTRIFRAYRVGELAR